MRGCPTNHTLRDICHQVSVSLATCKSLYCQCIRNRADGSFLVELWEVYTRSQLCRIRTRVWKYIYFVLWKAIGTQNQSCQVAAYCSYGKMERVNEPVHSAATPPWLRIASRMGSLYQPRRRPRMSSTSLRPLPRLPIAGLSVDGASLDILLGRTGCNTWARQSTACFVRTQKSGSKDNSNSQNLVCNLLERRILQSALLASVLCINVLISHHSFAARRHFPNHMPRMSRTLGYPCTDILRQRIKISA